MIWKLRRRLICVDSRYTTKQHINDAINKQPLKEYIIIKNEKPILDEKEVSVISSH